MAIIQPDGWRELSSTGSVVRGIETLEKLAAGLPDSYTVYHGIHWTQVEHGTAIFGTADFVLINPAGQLLLIEQKTGFLEETRMGLVKRHNQSEKRVAVQLAHTRSALLTRLVHTTGREQLHLDSLFYCPDYKIKNPGTAGIDPSRIVDASRRDHLTDIIRSLLPDSQPSSPGTKEIHRFFANMLDLVPDVSAFLGQSRALYTRLSGGLAYWARQIDCQPFRVHVSGTAGSGKTQLALDVLRDAVDAGRHPIYVCYNRPLADHIALIAPPGCTVATYHQLCDRIFRSMGREPDFSQPGAFRALEEFMAAFQPTPDWKFDELIVDEGQDFLPAWKDHLLKLLHSDGRAWWLEDPMQNLYGRAPLNLPGWVTIRAEVNFRSPKEILASINQLLERTIPISAGSPIVGSEVEFLTYANPAELMDRTKRAITIGFGAGFKKDMIALVTFRGREHSLFTTLNQLGPHALKAFTGQYDLLGTPLYSDGDLLIDSVYRFKGQSAPCIVFTEIDFTELDEAALRKLFVGMTRATMKLVLVLSERAMSNLRGKLDTFLG